MTIDCATVIDAPLAEVFAYHERPGALPRLFPPWLPARIESEAPSLREGDAVLRFPAGIRWVARHRATGQPHQFVDELVSLPLPWRHTHTFAAAGDSATQVTDRVETPVPAAFLRSTFRYRYDQLAGDLAAHRGAAVLLEARSHRPHLTVAITGSSGLAGTALAALLSTGGHRVIRLHRGHGAGRDERTWDPDAPRPDIFDGVDAVIHLAGASIAGRFTAGHKAAVRSSRVGPTERLAHALASSQRPPKVLIVASAIGYYGPDRDDELLDEDSRRGGGFLADLVNDWEAAAEPARQAGARVVHVRTGIVQSPRGGMLHLLRPLFAVGAGGPLGDGGQWLSWIDLDDLCDIYYRAVVDDHMEGPVNAVAPEPIRNREYTATLGRVLRRPAVLRVPAFGPRLLLGNEGAREFALASQRVVPGRLLRDGHRFRWPTLELSLRHQLGRFASDDGS